MFYINLWLLDILERNPKNILHKETDDYYLSIAVSDIVSDNYYLSISVSDIVAKNSNRGLKDLILVESFMNYIKNEKTLEDMIVTNVNQSLVPKLKELKMSSVSKLVENLSNYTRPEYLQNNSQTIITVTIFMSILIMSVTVRGLQFLGK